MNSLGRDIKAGEEVVVSGRVLICDNGAGMSGTASGGNIHGVWKETKERALVKGNDIDPEATRKAQARLRMNFVPARRATG